MLEISQCLIAVASDINDIYNNIKWDFTIIGYLGCPIVPSQFSQHQKFQYLSYVPDIEHSRIRHTKYKEIRCSQNQKLLLISLNDFFFLTKKECYHTVCSFVKNLGTLVYFLLNLRKKKPPSPQLNILNDCVGHPEHLTHQW